MGADLQSSLSNATETRARWRTPRLVTIAETGASENGGGTQNTDQTQPSLAFSPNP